MGVNRISVGQLMNAVLQCMLWTGIKRHVGDVSNNLPVTRCLLSSTNSPPLVVSVPVGAVRCASTRHGSIKTHLATSGLTLLACIGLMV